MSEIEKAIEELEPCPFCGKQPNVQENFPHNRLCTISCENKKCKVHPYRVDFCFEKAAKNWNLRTQPENKPLTLEQLKSMDEKPVYYQQLKSGYGRYRILNLTKCPFPPNTFINFDDSEKDELIENYGKTWLAYAHKPVQEDDTKCNT